MFVNMRTFQKKYCWKNLCKEEKIMIPFPPPLFQTCFAPLDSKRVGGWGNGELHKYTLNRCLGIIYALNVAYMMPLHIWRSNVLMGFSGRPTWVIPNGRQTTGRRTVWASDILVPFRFMKKKQWSRQFLECCWARTCSNYNPQSLRERSELKTVTT